MTAQITARQSSEITLKYIRKYPTAQEIAEAEVRGDLFADAPHETPYNVPQDADSWYEATVWVNDHILVTCSGSSEEAAIQAVFIWMNGPTIAAMLASARRE